jgi:hypothetical protein
LSRPHSLLSRIWKSEQWNTSRICMLTLSPFRELKNLAADISVASSRGHLARFLSSSDDASSLMDHTATLDHIIADFTVRLIPLLMQQQRKSSYHKLAMTSGTHQTLTKVQGGIEEIQGDVKVHLSTAHLIKLDANLFCSCSRLQKASSLLFL